MSDTSNAPSTASGKALVEYLSLEYSEVTTNIRDLLNARIRDIEDEAGKTAREDYEAMLQANRLRYGSPTEQAAAQLQEADTQLLTLRRFVEYVEEWAASNAEGIVYERAKRALNSTTEYNKQALARIREEAPLDAAWKRAEAALPGGANLAVTTIRSKGPAPSYRARSFEPFPAHITVTGNGPTPVAALNALADALASQSKSDTE